MCSERDKKSSCIEVIGYEMMTNLSSITKDDYNVVNHISEKSTTETSCNSLPSSEFMLGSKAVSSLNGCPKGGTNDKKWKDKMNYNNCVKSICDDFGSELEYS